VECSSSRGVPIEYPATVIAGEAQGRVVLGAHALAPTLEVGGQNGAIGGCEAELALGGGGVCAVAVLGEGRTFLERHVASLHQLRGTGGGWQDD